MIIALGWLCSMLWVTKVERIWEKLSTDDLELPSIIDALKMFWNYLRERRFMYNIDNVSLKYLIDKPNLNASEARWLAF